MNRNSMFPSEIVESINRVCLKSNPENIDPQTKVMFNEFGKKIWGNIKPKDRKMILKQEAKLTIRKIDQLSKIVDRFFLENYRDFMNKLIMEERSFKGVCDRLEDIKPTLLRLGLYEEIIITISNYFKNKQTD